MKRHRKAKQELKARDRQDAGNLWPQDTAAQKEEGVAVVSLGPRKREAWGGVRDTAKAKRKRRKQSL